MQIRFLPVLLITILPFLFSCKASKHLTKTKTSTSSQVNLSFTEESYIQTYRDIAVSEMRRTGIPASITLAQGMIESDYGRSMLAREANNHFGIKCHSDWTGQKVYHHDDRRNECFRKYARPEDSFLDHSQFLQTGSRYSFLFNLSSTDYKGWAHGLKKAGYATNPEYANMLVRTIEEKNLHYYDSGYTPAVAAQTAQTVVQDNPAMEPAVNRSSDKDPVPLSDTDKMKTSGSRVSDKTMVAARAPRVMENNRLQYIIVRDGDTREKLEEEFKLLHWELPKYNELESDFTLVPGQILYLQPKRTKAEPGIETHTVVEGDTMYEISQQYGVKLSSLYKMNRMTGDAEPQPGATVWLRSTKPVN